MKEFGWVICILASIVAGLVLFFGVTTAEGAPQQAAAAAIAAAIVIIPYVFTRAAEGLTSKRTEEQQYQIIELLKQIYLSQGGTEIKYQTNIKNETEGQAKLLFDESKKNHPKIKIGVIALLLLSAVLFGVSYFNTRGDEDELIEIEFSRFEDMVRNHDIKKLVLIKNEESLEISLRVGILLNPKYKKELRFSKTSQSGPQFRLETGSVDKFLIKYDEITKSITNTDDFSIVQISIE